MKVRVWLMAAWRPRAHANAITGVAAGVRALARGVWRQCGVVTDARHACAWRYAPRYRRGLAAAALVASPAVTCGRVGLSAIILALASQMACAGAPTLVPGAAQILVTTTFSAGQREPYADGQRSKFRKDELEALVEYGVREGFTAILAPRFTLQSANRFLTGDTVLDAENHAAGPRLDAGASLRAGLRARLWRDDHNTVALEFSGRAMTGARDILAGRSAGSALASAAELEARLLWQRGFSWFGLPWFVDVQGGWRRYLAGRQSRQAGSDPIRSQDVALLDLTLGVRVHPRLLLLAQSFSTVPLGSAKGRNGQSRDLLLHKAQLSVVWDLSPRWSAQIGLIATLPGGGPWRERGVLASVWRRFDPR